MYDDDGVDMEYTIPDVLPSRGELPLLDDEEELEELDCEHCPSGVVRQVWHGWCKKHSHAVWYTQVICRYLSQCEPDDMSDEAKAAHLTMLRTGKDPDDE